MNITYIHTKDAPAPGGHYAQGLRWDKLLFVSGQLPVDPGGGHAPEKSIAQQARQAFSNLKAVVEAAGGNLNQVLKTTIYISDISHWAEVDGVYREFFGDHTPARSVVPTRELHYGYQVEVEAIACIE